MATEDIPDAERAASDALPTEAEQVKLAQIRERLEEDLGPREAAGRLWPAIFGDLALIRHLRQAKGDVDKVCSEYSTLKDNFEKLDGDEMMAKCTAVHESLEKEGRLAQKEDIPGYADVKQFAIGIYNCDPTPAGDSVTYGAAADLKGGDIIEGGLWEKYRTYVICTDFVRLIELEKLSRKQGRLVKLVWIADLFNFSLNQNPKSYKTEDEKLQGMLKSLKPENHVNSFMLNMPWMIFKLASFAPKNELLHFCKGNGTEDADLMALVPAAKLMQYQATRGGSEESDVVEKDGSTCIARVLEKTLEVTAGQKVSWSFSVVAGAALTTSPKIEFGVEAMLFPKEAPDPAAPPPSDETEWKKVVAEPKHYFASDGEVTGEYTATDAGMVTFLWRNSNRLRKKYLHFKIECS